MFVLLTQYDRPRSPAAGITAGCVSLEPKVQSCRKVFSALKFEAEVYFVAATLPTTPPDAFTKPSSVACKPPIVWLKKTEDRSSRSCSGSGSGPGADPSSTRNALEGGEPLFSTTGDHSGGDTEDSMAVDANKLLCSGTSIMVLTSH